MDKETKEAISGLVASGKTGFVIPQGSVSWSKPAATKNQLGSTISDFGDLQLNEGPWHAFGMQCDIYYRTNKIPFFGSGTQKKELGWQVEEKGITRPT